MLTKSLHTITAATNVARYMLRRDVRGYYQSNPPAELALDALRVLGYPVANPADVTYQRIVTNCAKVLAAAPQVTAGARTQSASASGDRASLLQRQAG